MKGIAKSRGDSCRRCVDNNESKFRQFKFRAFLWLTLVWLVVAETFILIALGEFFHDPLLGGLSWFTLLPVGFFWLLAFDTMTRDAYEPVKLVVMAVVSAFVVFSSFIALEPLLQHTVYGDTFYMPGGVFAIPSFSWMGLNKAFQTYFLLKIYRHVPTPMRGTATRFWLTAAIMAGIGLFLVYGLNLSVYLPGAPAVDVTLAGSLGLIALLKEPRIAFVVPFKAYRLMVIKTTGGLLLFTHNWGGGDQFPDEDFFSGLVQGINIFAKQSLKKGAMAGAGFHW